MIYYRGGRRELCSDQGFRNSPLENTAQEKRLSLKKKRDISMSHFTKIPGGRRLGRRKKEGASYKGSSGGSCTSLLQRGQMAGPRGGSPSSGKGKHLVQAKRSPLRGVRKSRSVVRGGRLVCGGESCGGKVRRLRVYNTLLQGKNPPVEKNPFGGPPLRLPGTRCPARNEKKKILPGNRCKTKTPTT